MFETLKAFYTKNKTVTIGVAILIVILIGSDLYGWWKVRQAENRYEQVLGDISLQKDSVRAIEDSMMKLSVQKQLLDLKIKTQDSAITLLTKRHEKDSIKYRKAISNINSIRGESLGRSFTDFNAN